MRRALGALLAIDPERSAIITIDPTGYRSVVGDQGTSQSASTGQGSWSVREAAGIGRRVARRRAVLGLSTSKWPTGAPTWG